MAQDDTTVKEFKDHLDHFGRFPCNSEKKTFAYFHPPDHCEFGIEFWNQAKEDLLRKIDMALIGIQDLSPSDQLLIRILQSSF